MKPGFFIVMLVLYLALSAYVYVRGLGALPNIRLIKVAYTSIFVFLTIGYILGVMFRSYLPLWLSDFIELACSTWFIAFLYILVAVVLIDLLRLANYFFHFFPQWLTADVARTKLLTFISVLAALSLLFTWGYNRFTHPAVNQLTIKLDKQANGQQKIKLVVVSDIHMGSIIGKKHLQRFVDQINAQQPDIILMAGDVFNADLRPVAAQKMDEELRQLHAPLGVYAVLGNHEYIGREPDNIIAYLENAGVRVLRDSVANIADMFYVVGRDDRSNSQRKEMGDLLDSLDKQRLIIGMDHQPYLLEEVEEHGVDLMFYGHTHNGQVWPISLVVKKMYELAQGYKQKGNSHIYVSSGLGLWGPPFRIGTQSEIVVIQLELNE